MVKKSKPSILLQNNMKTSEKIHKKKTKPDFTKVKREAKLKVVETIQEIKDVQEQKKVKKIKNIMPSKYIGENIDACLLAFQELAKQYKKKSTIFEDETPIFAEIHCIKIPNTRNNLRFLLAHSTVASTGEVCLITPDIKKGRKIDHEPTVDRWEELLKKAGVTEIKTVLPVRQLKVEYDQYELKRRLLTQHDFIMVDTRVLTHVSHILGKMFFKKHNMLIPVRIHEEGNIKKDIETGLRTAMLRFNEGETLTMLIGHTGMSQDKIKENVLALLEQIQAKFPGSQANIRSIFLKLPLSISLPLYITLRSSQTVNLPKQVNKTPKHFKVLEDDLSTFPASKVRVAPDGTVRLFKTEGMDTSDNEADDNQESGNEKISSENDDE